MLRFPDQDHPRLRGEHSGEDLAMVSDIGITPAYAGNTEYACEGAYRNRDHPRLRGEHYITADRFIPLAGSPPPTRGTLSLVSKATGIPGITPAYAGNTA